MTCRHPSAGSRSPRTSRSRSGWIGAVAAYLALDVATTASQDPQTLRGAYLGMGLIVRFAATPPAPATTTIELHALPSTLVRSVGGMLLPLVILVLKVYKPQGMTRYGRRRQQAERPQRDRRRTVVVP